MNKFYCALASIIIFSSIHAMERAKREYPLREIIKSREGLVALDVGDDQFLFGMDGFLALQKELFSNIAKLMYRYLKHPSWVRSVAFNHDGKQLATGCDDGKARIWNVQTGQIMHEMAHPDRVRSVAFNHDGKQLATGCNDANIRVWDLQAVQIMHEIDYGVHIDSVVFNHDGTLITIGNHGLYRYPKWNARIWDVQTGKVMRQIGDGAYISPVVFNHDGKLLATVSDDGKVQIWNVQTRQVMHEIAHEVYISPVAFNHDGTLLATISDGGKARIWNVQMGQIMHEMIHPDRVRAVAFNHDGKQLATGCNDDNVRVWDLASIDSIAKWLTLNEAILLKAFTIAMNKQDQRYYGRIHACEDIWAKWRSLQAKLPRKIRSKLARFIVRGDVSPDGYETAREDQ